MFLFNRQYRFNHFTFFVYFRVQFFPTLASFALIILHMNLIEFDYILWKSEGVSQVIFFQDVSHGLVLVSLTVHHVHDVNNLLLEWIEVVYGISSQVEPTMTFETQFLTTFVANLAYQFAFHAKYSASRWLLLCGPTWHKLPSC